MLNWAIALALARGGQPQPEAAAKWMMRAIKSGKLGVRKHLHDYGSRLPGPFIAELQRLLTNEGAYNGRADGMFGPATMDAVNKLSRESVQQRPNLQ